MQHKKIHPKDMSLRLATDDFIPPSTLRCLGAIMSAAQDGKTLTVREIVAALGYRGMLLTMLNLRRLKAAGLITFEEKKARTIRPAVRFSLE